MKRILTILLSGMCLFSCMKYELDDEQWPSVDAEQVPQEMFQEYLVGKGWKHDITYRMKNGRVTNKDYYEDVDGASPAYYYYFGEAELTEFFTSDAYSGGPYYHTRPYEYRSSDCSIYANGYKIMTIVRVGEKSFDAIEEMGVKSDGTKVFGLSTFSLLSEEGLANIREAYRHNWKK